MKQRSKHIIKKQLDRELKHVHWLEKNLKSTALLKSSQKRLLKLYTELTVGNSK
jgi:hypothetical protein